QRPELRFIHGSFLWCRDSDGKIMNWRGCGSNVPYNALAAGLATDHGSLVLPAGVGVHWSKAVGKITAAKAPAASERRSVAVLEGSSRSIRDTYLSCCVPNSILTWDIHKIGEEIGRKQRKTDEQQDSQSDKAIFSFQES